VPRKPKNRDKTPLANPTEFIVPSKLKVGTVILLETNANVYELEIKGDNRALVSSASQKVRQTPCTIIGSVTSNGPVIAGKILQNHHLLISLPKRRFATGLIKGASVTNGKWVYDLWKDK
jgi:hypothetical protein